MKNKYLTNLNKIEFVITDACTGRCKHCSMGDHDLRGEVINSDVASGAVCEISREYDIKTVMVFGGEPLLYPDTVCKIIASATDMNVPKRQVITNGYFSNDARKIYEVAKSLSICGVNDLLLSVDAFHQETIPLDKVKDFARECLGCGIPIRLSPAWLVSRENRNPYNIETEKILNSFSEFDIPIGEGNIVFPEGNALKYLSEYFLKTVPENPYIEDPCNVKCISFSSNGDVLDGNIYKKDIMKIIEDYDPTKGNVPKGERLV